MITIKQDGKIIVPCDEAYIGHAGDNLSAVKEFFVEDVSDISLVYRMYLLFDDGTTNFFLLDSEVIEGGTKLTWNVTSDQIYKDGVVKMQIKASNSSGLVFHSDETSVIVNTSIEFSEAYGNKENSEFLYHEKYLNELLEKEKDIVNQLLEIPLDTEPKEGSTFGITSGAVYKINDALNQLTDTISQMQAEITSIDEKRVLLDMEPMENSLHGITSGAVYIINDHLSQVNTALGFARVDINKLNSTVSQMQEEITSIDEKRVLLDMEPMENSLHGITSGAVYIINGHLDQVNTALGFARVDINKLTGTVSQIQEEISSIKEQLETPLDTEPKEGSTVGITSGAVYAVDDKITKVNETLDQTMLDITGINETISQMQEEITSIDKKRVLLDMEPMENSLHGITSGAVYIINGHLDQVNTALGFARVDINKLTGTVSQMQEEISSIKEQLETPLDTQPIEGSNAGITSGAVYEIYQTVNNPNYSNEQINDAIRRIDNSIAELNERISALEN